MKRIVIVCEPDKVSEIMAACSPLASSISMEGIAAPAPASNVAPFPTRQAELPLNRKVHRRKDGTTWSGLADAFPVGQNFTMAEAEDQFIRLRYAGNSASPAISQLIKAGYIEKLGPNYFKFVKALPADWTAVKKKPAVAKSG